MSSQIPKFYYYIVQELFKLLLPLEKVIIASIHFYAFMGKQAKILFWRTINYYIVVAAAEVLRSKNKKKCLT